MSKQHDIAWLRNKIAQIESSCVEFESEAGLDLDPLSYASKEIEHDETIEDDKQDKKKASAFDRIVSMTSKRFRSERDIRFRLERENYHQDEINSAVSRAVNCLLIDDMRYADVMIRSRIRAGKGRQGIESELRREGIEPDSLYGWPYDYFPEDGEDELERAVRFLQLHPSRSKNPRQSAYRKLVQKGYSASIASSASRIWFEGL